jgi:hypothetical protein
MRPKIPVIYRLISCIIETSAFYIICIGLSLDSDCTVIESKRFPLYNDVKSMKVPIRRYSCE